MPAERESRAGSSSAELVRSSESTPEDGHNHRQRAPVVRYRSRTPDPEVIHQRQRLSVPQVGGEIIIDSYTRQRTRSRSQQPGERRLGLVLAGVTNTPFSVHISRNRLRMENFGSGGNSQGGRGPYQMSGQDYPHPNQNWYQYPQPGQDANTATVNSQGVGTGNISNVDPQHMPSHPQQQRHFNNPQNNSGRGGASAVHHYHASSFNFVFMNSGSYDLNFRASGIQNGQPDNPRPDDYSHPRTQPMSNFNTAGYGENPYPAYGMGPMENQFSRSLVPRRTQSENSLNFPREFEEFQNRMFFSQGKPM